MNLARNPVRQSGRAWLRALHARAFGAGLATDAFFVAFRIPNLLRRLFAEAPSPRPSPGARRAQEPPDARETRRLIDGVATTLCLALVVTAALGVALSPVIVYLSRLASPRIRPSSGSRCGCCASAFRTSRSFRWWRSPPGCSYLEPLRRAGDTPALLNIAFIVAAVFFAKYFDPPIVALAGGLRRGLLQLAFQVPFLVRLGLLPRWRLDLSHPGVRRVLKIMAPATFGVSVAQDLIADQHDLRLVPSHRKCFLALLRRSADGVAGGHAGVALGTILLPSLSKYHADANREEYAGSSTGGCA